MESQCFTRNIHLSTLQRKEQHVTFCLFRFYWPPSAPWWFRFCGVFMLHLLSVVVYRENTSNYIVSIHWKCRFTGWAPKLTFWRKTIRSDSWSTFNFCQFSLLCRRSPRNICSEQRGQRTLTQRNDQGNKQNRDLHPICVGGCPAKRFIRMFEEVCLGVRQLSVLIGKWAWRWFDWMDVINMISLDVILNNNFAIVHFNIKTQF